MAEIPINAFSGMNNLVSQFYAKKGVASPRVILNADVTRGGQVSKRSGLTELLSLPNAHSLWACPTCMLCASNGVLYDVSTHTATSIATISGSKTEPLSYVLVENSVYISNPYWSGVYNLTSRDIGSWGIDLPSGPVLITTDGGLPAGTYHVVFTSVSGGNLSGNGPVSSITLSDTGGIQIVGKPADTIVWATDQNGIHFNYVGDVNTIVEIPTVEPLPSFMCCPPPNMQCLAYAFGRVWGGYGNELHYSEPYQPGWFKPTSNIFTFDSKITLIAPVATGLFVGMSDSTIFLMGTEPDKMAQIDAGAGSIRGTLAYANNLPELGDVLGTPEKGFVDVPLWRTSDGIVVGNVSGKLYNLTKNKLKMGVPVMGASLYRQKDGEFQFLTSADSGNASSGAGSSDSVLTAIVKNGKLTTTNKYNPPDSSVVGVVEDVSCSHTRGGVPVE